MHCLISQHEELHNSSCCNIRQTSLLAKCVKPIKHIQVNKTAHLDTFKARIIQRMHTRITDMCTRRNSIGIYLDN